jgi:hypothetical protein
MATSPLAATLQAVLLHQHHQTTTPYAPAPAATPAVAPVAAPATQEAPIAAPPTG